MYCFLKDNPYSMGEHTLTCTLSPRGDSAEAAVAKKEVKREEPSKGSSDLKKCPEGSGVVQTAAAAPPVEPSVAKKEAGSVCHARGGTSALQIEPPEWQPGSAVREPAAARPAAGGEAAAAAEPAATEPAADESGEVQPPPCSAGKEEAVTNVSSAGRLECAGTARERRAEPEGSCVEAVAEAGAAAPLEGEGGRPHAAGKAPELPLSPSETLPPASRAAPLERVPPGDAQQDNTGGTPGKNPVPGTVRTGTEMPVAQSGVMTGRKLAPKTETAAEKELDVAGAELEMASEESVLEGGAAAEGKPAKPSTKTRTEAERNLEKSVAKVGAGVESAEKNMNGNNEGSLIKAPQNKGTEPAKADDTRQAVPLSSSLSVKESPAVSKTLLKAVVSLPDISKARVPVWRNETCLCKGEEQKAPSKPGPRSQAAVEKKAASKEVGPPRAGGSSSSLSDGSGTSRVNRSTTGDEKGGNGRNPPQQEKVSRVESRASSKQSQDRESRSSSVKTDNSSNKTSVDGSARASKSGSSSSAKHKEEEELFPFNLDEFVTVDEVIEEIESPVRTRRNPPRGKKRDAPKNSSSEPSSKRRKGKGSIGRVAESELSFVTLDEIGEEEDVATQLLGAAHLDALSDPQGLVIVDEVTEEEELIAEAVKDPQSLVTLDEISEQEDLGFHKDAPGSVFEEPDLKAEPLVTVDEIGEVEELPLNEPADLNVDDAAKQKEDDKDPGDFVSSQVPDDPSALVTVDEIQEDNEDAPLVTLDEVNEDEDDFLADFNSLKEELNFVTVDEIGEEDEDEDSSTEKKLNEDEDEDIVAVAGPEEEDIATIVGTEEEDIVAVAGPEEMEILGDMSAEEEILALSKAKGKESLAASEGEAANKLLAAGGQEMAKEIPAANKGETEKHEVFYETHERGTTKETETASKQQLEVDPLGSGEDEPESKQKKTDSSDAAKPQSTPKDLDFLVPKPGFFCQICSLFYADEISVKNHCKTALHQRNLEKFMAKQKEEDNNREERSSR
ncbi:ZN638 protein, partial [Eudromia elegans]|nr:ZN638 protein [Eudromia elegans]